MYTYQQSTGKLTNPDGIVIGTGYSGKSLGLNKPTADHVPQLGPIPRGIYTIGKAEDSPQLGPLSLPLRPFISNNMHGREGFFIHGDNQAMDYTASEGCIVLAHNLRQMIADDSEKLLEVIA